MVGRDPSAWHPWTPTLVINHPLPLYKVLEPVNSPYPLLSGRTYKGKGQQNAMGWEAKFLGSNPGQVPGHHWVPIFLTVKSRCPGPLQLLAGSGLGHVGRELDSLPLLPLVALSGPIFAASRVSTFKAPMGLPIHDCPQKGLNACACPHPAVFIEIVKIDLTWAGL